MSNYTKTTNFAAKDSLASGDPGKVIKGTEFNTEFDNIASASATKADKVASPVADNFLTMDSTGNLKNSGLARANFYYPGGTDVAIADGGTGASDAAGARTNLGLGALATLNAVGAAQITDGTVGNAELASNAVTAAKISIGLTYGSQSIATGGTWVVPAGIYTFASDANISVQLYTGTVWVGSGGNFGGTLISDGTNVRLKNEDANNPHTVSYRKLN